METSSQKLFIKYFDGYFGDIISRNYILDIGEDMAIVKCFPNSIMKYQESNILGILMSTNKPQFLYFSDPHDKETGWLCNQSYQSFILNKKRWSTVEHYIQSQKYPILEEEIRNCITIFATQRVVKKGEHRGLVISNWKYVRERIFRDAITAKFTQNKILKKMLINTYPLRLVNEYDNLSSKILEDIREKILPKPASEKYNILNVPTNKDVVIAGFSATGKGLCKTILSTTKQIMVKEGCAKIYKEMLSDSFALIFPKFKGLCDVLNDMTIGALKNFPKLVNDVLTYTKTNGYKLSKTSKHYVTRSIALFLRWRECSSTSYQKKYIDRCSKAPIVVTLSQGKRKYRNDSVPINGSNVLEIESKTTNKEKKDGIQNKSLLISVEGEILFVSGYNLGKHASKLLGLGGRYHRVNGNINTDSIQFSLDKKETIEEFIEANLSPEEVRGRKVQQRIMEFISFFHDIVSRLNVEKNYSNSSKICNLISKEDRTHDAYIISEKAEDAICAIALDEASLHYLKKRIMYLNHVRVPNETDFVDVAWERLYEGLKPVIPDGKTKKDVFKVFLKDETKCTLTLNEDIRRVARVYERSTKVEEIPSVVHIPQPTLPPITPIKKPKTRQPKILYQAPNFAPTPIIPIDTNAGTPINVIPITKIVEENDTLKEIADSIEIEIKRDLKDFVEDYSE